MGNGQFKKGQDPWNKGTKKETDLSEIRECRECGKEKGITQFVKGKGILYRYKCKECKNKKRRKGTISGTRFKVGHDKGVRFKEGHTPWYKTKEVPHPALGTGDRESTNRFTSYLYKKWRKEVLKRDKRRCVKCGDSKLLAAHHISPWKESVSKRFDVDNGIALCASCHAKQEGLGTKIRPA